MIGFYSSICVTQLHFEIYVYNREVVQNICIYEALKGILNVTIAVGKYIINQCGGILSYSGGTVYKWHKRVSMQRINKGSSLSMFVKVQEINIEVTYQITIFTFSSKGIKQIIKTIIKQLQICIRGSVYYTNNDIPIFVKYIFINFNKSSFI